MAGQHLIIAGTGRAGTTALVELLDACGLETNRPALEYHPAARAGLEQDIEGAASYVVKKPDLSEDLASLLAAGFDAGRIDAVIVPIRDLDGAVFSRLDNFRRGGINAAGGLWKRKRPSRQRLLLARAVHQLLYTCDSYDIPTILLAFPRFVRDPAYTWRRLLPVLGGLGESSFVEVHRSVIRHEYVGSTRVYRRPEIIVLDVKWLLVMLRRKLVPRIRRMWSCLIPRVRALRDRGVHDG